jgi:hypothetical protein
MIYISFEAAPAYEFSSIKGAKYDDGAIMLSVLHLIMVIFQFHTLKEAKEKWDLKDKWERVHQGNPRAGEFKLPSWHMLRLKGSTQKIPCMDIPGLKRVVFILRHYYSLKCGKCVEKSLDRLLAGDHTLIHEVSAHMAEELPVHAGGPACKAAGRPCKSLQTGDAGVVNELPQAQEAVQQPVADQEMSAVISATGKS